MWCIKAPMSWVIESFSSRGYKRVLRLSPIAILGMLAIVLQSGCSQKTLSLRELATLQKDLAVEVRDIDLSYLDSISSYPTFHIDVRAYEGYNMPALLRGKEVQSEGASGVQSKLTQSDGIGDGTLDIERKSIKLDATKQDKLKEAKKSPTKAKKNRLSKEALAANKEAIDELFIYAPLPSIRPYLDAALREGNSLAILSLALKSAALRTSMSKLEFIPSLSLGASSRSDLQRGGQASYDGHFSANFNANFATQILDILSAKNNTFLASLALRDGKRALLGLVARSYYNLYISLLLLDNTQKILSLSAKNAKLLALKYRANLAQKSELDRARARVLSVQNSLIKLKEDIQKERSLLASLGLDARLTLKRPALFATIPKRLYAKAAFLNLDVLASYISYLNGLNLKKKAYFSIFPSISLGYNLASPLSTATIAQGLVASISDVLSANYALRIKNEGLESEKRYLELQNKLAKQISAMRTASTALVRANLSLKNKAKAYALYDIKSTISGYRLGLLSEYELNEELIAKLNLRGEVYAAWLNELLGGLSIYGMYGRLY